MKDNHKLDEQIEEYLRAEEIKPRQLISFEAKQFLVSRSKSNVDRKILFFVPFAIAASIVFNIFVNTNSSDENEGDLMSNPSMEIFTESDTQLLEDYLLTNPELNDFFLLSEESALELLAIIEPVN